MTKLLYEDLSKEDEAEVKSLIKSQLLSLFYLLYVKKSFWSN